jgi:RNA polymerase sigma-70 factor (ECF subfamily)
MPTTFSAARLLAELPRLRRYARILTDTPEGADRLVEETLARAKRIQEDPDALSAPGTRLIALLRAVNAENTGTAPAREANLPVPRGSAPQQTDPNPGTDPARMHSDRGKEMLARLHELPLEQREILVLVAVERLAYAQVAILLHMPVATVVSRLAQARETLRTSTSKAQSTPGGY